MAKTDNLTPPTKCPICGATPCHPGHFEGAGNNERGDISSNILAALKEKNIIVNLQKHTFYRQKEHIKKVLPDDICKVICDPIEAHHLICWEATKEKDWKDIFDFFSYDINCAENGVLFPGDMQVACHYGVPLHKGNHNATIADFKSFKVKKAYVQSVKKKLKNLKTKAKEYCDKENANEEFKKRIKKISEDILNLLVKFTWTITADGRDYQKLDGYVGGIGCYKNTSIERKRKAMLQIAPIKGRSKMTKPELHEALRQQLNNTGLCGRNHKKQGCIKTLKWSNCTILNVKK